MPIVNRSNPTFSAQEIDKRVSFQISRDLSEKQKNQGILAKVNVKHPAFTVVATVWQKNGRAPFVTVPQQEDSNKENTWHTLVNLNKECRDHIVFLVMEEKDHDEIPWYMKGLGEANPIIITNEDKNESLGIECINADGDMSANQKTKGMVWKVNIVTSIATLYQYTVSKSRFGPQLYGNPPFEAQNDDGRGIPGYKLSEEAVQQVLAFLHQYTTFEEAPVTPKRNRSRSRTRAAAAVVDATKPETKATGTESATAGGFVPVSGNEVFDAVE